MVAVVGDGSSFYNISGMLSAVSRAERVGFPQSVGAVADVI